jgi:sugar/nucleoside kinase (ribokinase family)
MPAADDAKSEAGAVKLDAEGCGWGGRDMTVVANAGDDHWGRMLGVVTLGAERAAYSGPDGEGIVPATKAEVVDTTGAGDAFLGCLALAVKRGKGLGEAVAAAVSKGTVSVGQRGSLLRR